MGLLGTLFGGSKSTSGNQSYDYLKDQLGGVLGGGVNFFNALKDELSGGFDAYKKKIGFDFGLGEGLKGISGTRAAGGGLRTGDTARASNRYATDYASTKYDNYLNQIGNASNQGLNAAGIIANAGQTSKSKSGNGVLTSLFSDRRIKRDIEQIGVADNGLPIYRFRYEHDAAGIVHIGFMADEVEQLHPDAVSTDPHGIKMVDYGKAVL